MKRWDRSSPAPATGRRTRAFVIHILVAVDHVVVAVELRGGTDALQVGAGLGSVRPIPVRRGRWRGRAGSRLSCSAPVDRDHPAGERVAAEDAGDTHRAARDLLETRARTTPGRGRGRRTPRGSSCRTGPVCHAGHDSVGYRPVPLPLPRDGDDLDGPQRTSSDTELLSSSVKVNSMDASSGRRGGRAAARPSGGRGAVDHDPLADHQSAPSAGSVPTGPRPAGSARSCTASRRRTRRAVHHRPRVDDASPDAGASDSWYHRPARGPRRGRCCTCPHPHACRVYRCPQGRVHHPPG